MSSPVLGFERENAVLFAAARLEVFAGAAGGAAATDARPDGGEPLDWTYIRHAAIRQGIAPLFYDWLHRHPCVEVPEVVRSHLRDAYWANHFRNQLLFAELARVCSAAAAIGVEVMPLKGAQLAVDYYPSSALRFLSDLDLLVRPPDADRMSGVLRALGYQQVPSSPSYMGDCHPDEAARECSWVAAVDGLDSMIEYRTEPLELAVGRLTDVDRALTGALRSHADEVWTRATCRNDRALGLRMSPEDLLLEVSTHVAAKHLDFRLIWLHDIARILSAPTGVDWDWLAGRIRALRVSAPVHAALSAAVRWTRAPSSGDVLERLAGPLRARSSVDLERWELRRLLAHVEALGSRDLTAPGPGVWPVPSALARVRGVWPRLTALRWVAWPHRSYLTHRGVVLGQGPLGYLAANARRYLLRLPAANEATRAQVAGRSPDRSV